MRKILFSIVFIIICFCFVSSMLSSIDDGANAEIPAPSYLGVGLGMIRDEVFVDGDFVSKYASKLLEVEENKKEPDDTIIKAKAVPLINHIYFQFVKDLLTTTNTGTEKNNEKYEYKLYEILIQLNETYFGYYELLDALTKGLEVNNPYYGNPEDTFNKPILKYKGYGTPAIVEPERAIWEDDKVKIILTRSNKINRYGNVVRFIHKKGFEYIVNLNNPTKNASTTPINFSDIEVIGENPPKELIITEDKIAKFGRKLFLFTALLPQELKD